MFHIFISPPVERTQPPFWYQSDAAERGKAAPNARKLTKRLIRRLSFAKMPMEPSETQTANGPSDLFLRVRRHLSTKASNRSKAELTEAKIQKLCQRVSQRQDDFSSSQGQGLSGSTLVSSERSEFESVASQSPEPVQNLVDTTGGLSNQSTSKRLPYRYTISSQSLPILSAPEEPTHNKSNIAGDLRRTETAPSSKSAIGGDVDVSHVRTGRSAKRCQDDQTVVSKIGGVTITRSRSRSKSKPNGLAIAPATRSESRSHSRSRSDRSKKKNYPPASFPEDFYQRFPNPDSLFPYGRVDLDVVLPHNSLPYTQPDLASASSKAEFDTSSVLRNRVASESSHIESDSFYEVTHHFTDCSHTCPPATRPLNTQPYLQQVLHPDGGSLHRSMIDGACFVCDSERRRNGENLVVESYTAQLERLMDKLSTLIARLEADESHLERDRGPDHQAKIEDDVFNAAVGNAIRLIEQEIVELRDTEESEIKAVWKGYSSRWGPGTLGIHWTHARSSHESSMEGASNDTKLQTKDVTGGGSQSPVALYWDNMNLSEGRMKVEWIRPDKSNEK